MHHYIIFTVYMLYTRVLGMFEVSAVWQTQAKSTEQIKCGLITNSQKKLELTYKKRQLH